MTERPSQTEKAKRFRALHEGEPFVIPNPWDAGSAKLLASLGFEALATTSSGFAFTLGRADGDTKLGEVIHHVAHLAGATNLPVSVDLENGYGDAPEDAARAIRAAAEAGAVGGSIEDYARGEGIYELGHATERVAAAAEAARELGIAFTLTGRSENQLHGDRDLDETISRLRAYEDAGADALFAPGLRRIEEVRAICDAVSRPVNVLGHPGLSLGEIVDAGAQRISVGGALTWVAYSAVASAAERIRDEGDLGALASRADLASWLSV